MTLSFRPNPPSRVPTQPLKIVAMGDSLVYGYGDPIGGGWVERLRRQWMAEATSPILYNLGIRGDRVGQVIQRLEREFSLRGEIRNRLPDRLILSVGVNDSARLRQPDGKPYTDFSIFQDQIRQLLDRARALCPVLFVGMVPVNEANMPFLGCLYFNHFDQYRFKEFTKRACEERQIPYLDLFEWWMARDETWRHDLLSPDGLHPNSKGYQAIWERVACWPPIAGVAAGV